MKHTKKEWIFIILVTVTIMVFLIVSNSFRRDAFPNVPSEYRFGAIAPFFFDSDQLKRDNLNASAQFVFLGEKPLLRIEKLNISQCESANIFLSAEIIIDIKDKKLHLIDLGKVRYYTGNSNYEIPFDVDTNKFPYVTLWCNTEHSSIGHAFFQI